MIQTSNGPQAQIRLDQADNPADRQSVEIDQTASTPLLPWRTFVYSVSTVQDINKGRDDHDDHDDHDL
jgi:hypothetical protein